MNAVESLAARAAAVAPVAPAGNAGEAGSADRFLKLLVAQMQSQDPLNPMDNAQVTSQMAQINTVEGLTKLNATVAGLNTQFVQMQTLQGASLVGHDVTVRGNRIAVEQGVGSAGFELAGTADGVKVEILSPSGRVVETLDLGTQGAGVHAFEWRAPGVADGANHTFRVVATAGTAPVEATPLMRDRVTAVSTQGSQLLLQTEINGSVAYRDVKAFN